jgi:hypothetical protein
MVAGHAAAECTAVTTPEIYRDADDAPRVADIAYVDAQGEPCGRARQEVADGGVISFEYGPDEELAFYYVDSTDGEAPGSAGSRHFYSAAGELLFVEVRTGARSDYRDASGAALTECQTIALLPSVPLHRGSKACAGP